MNRRAAATSRHKRAGYLHRINASARHLTSPGVFHAMVQHDAACAIYRSASCDCVPDISIIPTDGDDVILIDTEGRATRQRRQ